MKLIREFDDFDWIREIPLNPWLVGDGIYFDIKPKADDIRSYIQMALDSRKVDNSRYWHTPYDSDVKTILFYFRDYGSAVLGIDRDGFNSLTFDNNTVNYVDDMEWIKYSDLVKGNLNESDDFDWIRDIPAYIPYGDVKVGNSYAVWLNPLLFEALTACGHNHEPFKQANRVEVLRKKAKLKYHNVFCGHPGEDEVRGLLLVFYHDDIYINHFWVMEGMVDFLPMDNDLNESQDDGLDWIRGIEPKEKIMSKPNTVYYFEPPLEENEIYGFVDRIGNTEEIKDWLLDHLDVRINYFAIGQDKQLEGWCDELDVEDARGIYGGYDFVDARSEFFI